MTAGNKSRLNAIIRQGEGWTAVRLSGVIDEHNGLRQLTERLDNPVLFVDLGGVRRINSVGVRDWVTWLDDLKKRSVRPVLIDCPPGIMDQVNLVRNFAAGTTIETFFAPYYCDVCDKEENYRLQTFDLMAQTERRAPVFHCDRSDCGMALDDVEENYFAFLEDQKVPPDLSTLQLASKAARQALDAAGDAMQSLTSQSGSNSTPFGRSPSPAGPSQPNLPAAPSAVTELAGAPSNDTQIRAGGDIFFIVVVLVMLGLLGFIVYLILGLE